MQTRFLFGKYTRVASAPGLRDEWGALKVQAADGNTLNIESWGEYGLAPGFTEHRFAGVALGASEVPKAPGYWRTSGRPKLERLAEVGKISCFLRHPSQSIG